MKLLVGRDRTVTVNVPGKGAIRLEIRHQLDDTRFETVSAGLTVTEALSLATALREECALAMTAQA